MVSIRNSILVTIAAISALLSTQANAETVHDETYPMEEGNSFYFSIYAMHDAPSSESTHEVEVLLFVTIRDENENVVSSSCLVEELQAGECDEQYRYEDIGMWFDTYEKPRDLIDHVAEYWASCIYTPPGTLGDYTIEITLLKILNSDDPEDVEYYVY